MIKQIPNLLTLLNLLSGFAATFMAINGDYENAVFLIMAGMIFDFSDGMAARLLKAYSPLGKDLDSLADIVTFGIAPGAILVSLLVTNGMGHIPSLLAGGIIPAASAFRLAKFNNDDSQKSSFKGMATPASAFVIASLILAAEFSASRTCVMLISTNWFLVMLAFFLAVMMNINMRMFSLKITNLQWKGNEERYLFVLTSLVLLVSLRAASFPLIMAAYIIISVIFSFVRHRDTVS